MVDEYRHGFEGSRGRKINNILATLIKFMVGSEGRNDRHDQQFILSYICCVDK